MDDGGNGECIIPMLLSIPRENGCHSAWWEGDMVGMDVCRLAHDIDSYARVVGYDSTNRIDVI